MSPKQQRFVEEYLVDLNATAAAKRAGYSERRASEIGWQLLQKTTVQEAIQAAREKLSRKTEITAEYVLTRLKMESELTGEGSSHSARVRAIELLGKHIAMFSDRLIHTAAPELLDVVRKALANADTSNILAVLSDRLSGVPPVPEPGGPGLGGLGGALANGPAPVPTQSLPHSSRNGTH